MAFEAGKWVDGEDGGTPITAAELNRIEAAGVAASAAPTWAQVTGKPSTFAPATHTHAAADIASGTLADARIPSLAIGKVTGLQAALDGKQASGSYATAAALADLTARVEALEAAQPEA